MPPEAEPNIPENIFAPTAATTKKAKLRGEHFQWPEGVKRVDEKDDTPSGIISLIPIAFVLLIFNLTKLDIIICLLLGILLALALFWKYLPKEEMLRMFNDAAVSSITIIMNTAAIVGVGSVIKGASFYSFATDMLMSRV